VVDDKHSGDGRWFLVGRYRVPILPERGDGSRFRYGLYGLTAYTALFPWVAGNPKQLGGGKTEPARERS